MLSPVCLFAAPWTAAHQASLSFTISQSSLKLMSIESLMPCNHLILCCPFFLLPSIFPNIRVFFQQVSSLHNVVKVWSFSMNEQLSFWWMTSDQSGNSYHVICGHLRAKKPRDVKLVHYPRRQCQHLGGGAMKVQRSKKNIYFSCGTVKTQRGLWIPLKHQRCWMQQWMLALHGHLQRHHGGRRGLGFLPTQIWSLKLHFAQNQMTLLGAPWGISTSTLCLPVPPAFFLLLAFTLVARESPSLSFQLAATELCW